MATKIPSEAPKRNSYRAPLARRATKGPLDGDDPLASQPPIARSSISADAVNTPVPTTPFSPELPFGETPIAPLLPPSKDFSYLLRPEIYHPLSQSDLPSPFRSSKHQSYPSNTLSGLLAENKFRTAAVASAQRLTSSPAPPPSEIFSLIYTRLACLVLLNHLAFAAEESKALQDVNSPFYKDEVSGESFLCWELRVLAVRLQGIGYGDARRGVGVYYDLAREARAEAKKAVDVEEKRLWKYRVQELGIFVANALIEMGDLGAAARHLESLRGREGHDEVLNGRLALLYVTLGDVEAARICLGVRDNVTDLNTRLRPLLSMAEGRYEDTVEEWKVLPRNDIVTQNLAVCLFYTGRGEETLELLDSLVEKGRSFHALTFNLATVYELCSDKGREKKEDLVARVAKSIEEQGGGERNVADFKLKL